VTHIVLHSMPILILVSAGDHKGEVLPDRQDGRLKTAIAEGKAAGLLPDAKQVLGAQLAVSHAWRLTAWATPFPLSSVPFFPFPFLFPFFPFP